MFKHFFVLLTFFMSSGALKADDPWPEMTSSHYVALGNERFFGGEPVIVDGYEYRLAFERDVKSALHYSKFHCLENPRTFTIQDASSFNFNLRKIILPKGFEGKHPYFMKFNEYSAPVHLMNEPKGKTYLFIITRKKVVEPLVEEE